MKGLILKLAAVAMTAIQACDATNEKVAELDKRIGALENATEGAAKSTGATVRKSKRKAPK